jgi:hypothetical protein
MTLIYIYPTSLRFALNRIHHQSSSCTSLLHRTYYLSFGHQYTSHISMPAYILSHDLLSLRFLRKLMALFSLDPDDDFSQSESD